jgi:ATP-binding cassette subfamily B protein
MVKLLVRLYDPTEGRITCNGVDIRELDYEEYKKVFSVVFQDFCLPSLALGQNVAASSEYDAALAKECLDLAGFDFKDMTLDTCLYKDYDKNGVQISGGEAQKIALARALYKSRIGANFIILDEPTAALDPLAESEVYSSFDKLTGGATSIYISHRLSSCRFCDSIAVFHQGELLEQGTHEVLLERGGKYAELWKAQAQYYVSKPL